MVKLRSYGFYTRLGELRKKLARPKKKNKKRRRNLGLGSKIYLRNSLEKFLDPRLMAIICLCLGACASMPDQYFIYSDRDLKRKRINFNSLWLHWQYVHFTFTITLH